MSRAAPTVVGVGAMSSASSGNARARLPTGYRKNDLALLLVESSALITTPTGWTFLTSVDCSAGATNPTFLSVFYRYLNDSEPDSWIPADANHSVASVVVVRGCPVGLTPFVVTASDTELPGSTSVVFPGGTTTADNCLVIDVVAHGLDISSTTRLSGWTNAALSDYAEILDTADNAGNGGGLGAAAGVKATAGAIGSSTATLATLSSQARLTLALRPDPWVDGYAEEHQAIMARIQDNWSLTDVAWPNTKYPPDADDDVDEGEADAEAYIEPIINTQDAFNADISGPGSRTSRHPGLLTVNVRVPINTGDGTALSHADAVVDLFRNVTFERISFRVPTVRIFGAEGEWYRVQVDCPYYRDTVN